MTTSGSYAWNPTLTQIVRQAHLNIGAIQDGEEVSASMFNDAVFVLNGMVKALEATGLHVWAEEEAILFLQPDQAKYVIGGSGITANTSDADEWIEATLAQPASAGATSIVLEDALLILDGMAIGIVLSDGITFWTTVNGSPVADVVTLTDALLGATEAGNYALAYTTKIVRPLKVPKARLLTLNGLNETPMTILSRQEYMDLPQKLSPGTPTQWFYSPQRDTGLLYVWPVPETSAWAVRFTWYRPLQDYLSPNNTSDFPQEWITPLMWNLSKELAPSFDVPDAKWAKVKEMADTYAIIATSYDRESEPVQFGLDSWLYDG